MNKIPKIAIVIPAYNESAVIYSIIKKLHQAMVNNHYSFEIIVVDDGSKDDTAKKARDAGALVIRHLINSGSGSATATGLSYAQQQGFTVVATMDADGQHDPFDVIKGLKALLNSSDDLLIGSRLFNTAGMSRIKIIGNKGLSFITRLLFGINVADTQSGLRIFSRNAVERLKWKTIGYEFCSEMLWRAKQQNLKVKEFPIQAIYTNYSRSKGQNNWNALIIVRSLLKTRIMEFFNE